MGEGCRDSGDTGVKDQKGTRDGLSGGMVAVVPNGKDVEGGTLRARAARVQGFVQVSLNIGSDEI